MLTVLLHADGWRVEYLGADTPPAQALALAEALDADVVCFSAALAESAAALEEQFAGTPHRDRPAIVVGGHAVDDRFADRVGARRLDDDLVAAVRRLRDRRPVSYARSAAAGAAAATVWGLQEPLDRAAFRSGYSDIALLGKLVTRGSGWRAAGFGIHAANGAAFGLAFEAAAAPDGLGAPALGRRPGDGRARHALPARAPHRPLPSRSGRAARPAHRAQPTGLPAGSLAPRALRHPARPLVFLSRRGCVASLTLRVSPP